MDGNVVAHHSVWFARDCISQKAPDEVSVRQQNAMSELDWQQQRGKDQLMRPEQKQMEPSKLSCLKSKDLNESGKLMSRDAERKDFSKRFPNPDKHNNK